MKTYLAEIDGQREFYERIGINPDLSHNTDGVDNGNLYENKLNIDNINKVLFQAIKYASRIRIRGEKLPANIILNDLNRETAYIFQSADLLNDIEKVYFGAASKGNDEFTTTAKHIEIDYSTSAGLLELLKYVNSNNFVKYHIDQFNIIGLSQQYYKINPDKDSFVKGPNAEIRNPIVLKDRIYPYNKPNNLEFEDIMDRLNPGLLQREQGAYYTPKAYVDEMHKLLYQAIREVPDGMDYIIIDRCAGTGNLEEGLPDEILKHCILSTIEFNEYVILNFKYGDKCLVVIPNTDALAFDIIPAEHNEQGIANDYIREKVNDENCVVILMENPPFSESGSGGSQNTGKKENAWKQSFVIEKMRDEHKGVVLNDLSNLFIWSGFKYYILYIHPYFDYNGRTARMVSFWLNYINKITFAPYFMSEAINESKHDYYRAITDTRNTNNDLTYFLGYILETSIKYSFIYKNLEEIKNMLSKTGDTLTSSEWVYVKKILVHNSEDYFNYKMFLTYINANMSRQGALKILNNLHSYDILEKTKNKKGDIIFKFNQDFITYKYHK